MFQKHRIKIAILISILLHILILVLYRPLSVFLQLVPDSKAESVITEPLVFEFEDPPKPKEVVETLEEARVDKAPDDAQFYSDKNARAQDMYADNNLPNGMSFSEGISDYRTFAGMEQAGEQSETPSQDKPTEDFGQDDQFSEQKEQSEAYKDSDPLLQRQTEFSQQMRPKFTKDVLFGQQQNNKNGMLGYTDDANWNNQESSADNLGGISLSSYNWNYAPYIMYLKRKVQEKIYPPSAFYSVSGMKSEVVVNMVVHRDGTIEEPQLVANDGHESFISTSVNALKAASPYKPLPDDFPEDRLVITWTFGYQNYR